MEPPAAHAVSRVEIEQSRQLISDSRALIAAAKALMRQSRWTIRQQSYLQIVCAWCQQTIRWERAAGGRSAIVFVLTVLRLCLGNYTLATTALCPRRREQLHFPPSCAWSRKRSFCLCTSCLPAVTGLYA